MRLSDTDFGQEERELLSQVMERDEDIIWYGRPDGKLSLASFVPVMMFSLIWIGISSAIIWVGLQDISVEEPDLMLCLPAIFLLLGLLLPVGYRHYHKRRSRSVYVLTPKRAILLEPKMFSGVKVFTYPVEEDMLLGVTRKKDGSGSLIFDHSDVVVNDKPLPRGFLNLSDVERPLALLREMGVKAGQVSYDL